MLCFRKKFNKNEAAASSSCLENYPEIFNDFDGYDSDFDKEYLPPEESSNSESADESTQDPNTLADEHVCADNAVVLGQILPKKSLKRKRVRKPETWKCNVRKAAHEAGKEYISIRKKVVPEKRIKTPKDCRNNCLFKCQNKITEDERKIIFNKYYTLNEHGKRLFILSTTNKFNVERHRKNKTDANSRRKQSFAYHFQIGSNRIQVCKVFYLGTLAISQTPVYTAHVKTDISNIPDTPKVGKHIKHKIPVEDVNFVKQHIESFPKIESHYCRANTEREYLDSTLSIKKMYSLYVESCIAAHKNAVKESFYRNIFSTEYNLYFHVPKKDRCDICEEVKLRKAENSLSEEKAKEYENHVKEKNATRNEKAKDRERKDTPFLVFDLQNVLSCPQAEISNYYYKSKLNVYNLTAILSSTKQVYCAEWHEMLMGRAGNDIASALIKILEAVFADNKTLETLILWSDSCVPQNRNSLMSYAIAYFLQMNPSIQSITMKFSTTGHSCVQEIDSVHSCIERVLAKVEYFSPISLLRILLKVNSAKPYKIIQMRIKDFKDYKSAFNYKVIPFSKVKALKFTNSFTEVEYKVSHQSLNWEKVSIRPLQKTRSMNVMAPKVVKEKKTLSAEKVKAIKSMYPWMPQVDKEYFESILPK